MRRFGDAGGCRAPSSMSGAGGRVQGGAQSAARRLRLGVLGDLDCCSPLDQHQKASRDSQAAAREKERTCPPRADPDLRAPKLFPTTVWGAGRSSFFVQSPAPWSQP